MADPKQLTDEELNKVVETGEEPEEPETLAEEPAKTDDTPDKEEPEESVSAKDDENPEEEKPPSRREQLRIQTLLKKYGPPENRQSPSQPKPEALDYEKSLEADPEVIKQLEADRQANGQAQYAAGVEATRAEIQTSEWRTILTYDAPRTEEKYPWLNPGDEANFEPAIADAMNTEYKHLVGYDEQTGLVARPGIRYSDFIDAKVELSERLAKAMTARTSQNIAKQAANTGLRPDGSSAKRLNLNQAPQNMTTEELYAAIGQKQPKK